MATNADQRKWRQMRISGVSAGGTGAVRDSRGGRAAVPEPEGRRLRAGQDAGTPGGRGRPHRGHGALLRAGNRAGGAPQEGHAHQVLHCSALQRQEGEACGLAV